MCENFDHGTNPKRTAVAIRYNTNIKFAPDVPVACIHPQTRPNVTLMRSERINKSARTMRNGE
jgi:hypothetical protein